MVGLVPWVEWELQEKFIKESQPLSHEVLKGPLGFLNFSERSLEGLDPVLAPEFVNSFEFYHFVLQVLVMKNQIYSYKNEFFIMTND